MILFSLPSLHPRDVEELALFADQEFRAGQDSLDIARESGIAEPDVLRLIQRGREMRKGVAGLGVGGTNGGDRG